MINKNDELYTYYVISKNIKRIRKEKGLTQAQLAELTNYSEGFIRNIESEKYLQTFAIGTIANIAKALNVDIRELFTPLDGDNKK